MDTLLPNVPPLQVDTYHFPATVKPPGSDKTLFLGGAGARGLEINGNFVKFTAIGVYVASEALPSLAGRWKGKTAKELAASVDFFLDVITGPFEKFTRVTMILPLTGQQYSEKVAENCIAIWKSMGIYTDQEAMAVDKFKHIFKDEKFPPGASILFTQFPSGSLKVTFSKDESMPEEGNGGVIENKAMSQAVIASIIGPNGVSPEAKESLAGRMAELLSDYKLEVPKNVNNGGVEEMQAGAV